MADLIYKTGDLTQADEFIIAHGCNAQGVMGSGVAKAIRAKWPSAYSCYRRHFEEDSLRLGDVIYAPCGEKIIANCITQEFYGRQKNKIYVNYSAIRICMVKINDFVAEVKRIQRLEGLAVAMPMIGAGLGGGDWSKIANIIKDESDHFYPIVYQI